MAPGAVAAVAGGLALAAAVSLAGALARGRARRAGARTFRAVLLGSFLGRLALLGLYGLALLAVAPTHLAAGLVSLAGFHFVFTVLEVASLARMRRARGRPEGRARTTG